MSENECCKSCAPEPSSEPTGLEDAGSLHELFDDAALTQNVPTDSAIFPIGVANRFMVTGVVINRTAVATITFSIQVSSDRQTWTSYASFNISTLGYFTSSGAVLPNFPMNAKYVKCRSSTASAATVVYRAALRLYFK